MNESRREFIKKAVLASAGVAFASSAKSYARILGANDRINFGLIGLHGRGYAHLEGVMMSDNAFVTHICDVD
ncbi:MAG: gfo/Idh/MocA family oxidoreductase, partial [Bacteroidota bacterium]